MTDDKNKVALLPCPFCGDEPSIISRFNAFGIRCVKIDHCVQIYGGTEAEAIAAWNTRQPQPDALKMAREALERIEVATRNEVRAGDKGYVSRYGINGIARAALKESE